MINDNHNRFISDKYPWTNGTKPEIMVLRPPDFRQAENRRRMSEMVERFENTTFSVGAGSTQFFLRGYLDFLSFHFPDLQAAADYIPQFYNVEFMGPFLEKMGDQRQRGW